MRSLSVLQKCGFSSQSIWFRSRSSCCPCFCLKYFSTTAQSSSNSDSSSTTSTQELRGAILHDSPLMSSVILAGAPKIRNFAIIAHIDHGKSTLSDCLLERAGNLSHSASISGENAQTLDTLTVERERGITVKAQGCAMFYRRGDDAFNLNLIDTPGHVDFSYEVSRSLSACQGVLLLIDASQGIQAQTLATYEMATLIDLSLIPVLTKIDLPHAEVDTVKGEICELFEGDFGPSDILCTSSKSGVGIDDVFDAIIDRIPPPPSDLLALTSNNSESDSAVLEQFEIKPLRALLYDSFWDAHRGVVCLVHIKEGCLRTGDTVGFYFGQSAAGKGVGHNVAEATIQECGLMIPECVAIERLTEGQCGYIVTGIRDTSSIQIGDTLFLTKNRTRKHVTKATKANAAKGLTLNLGINYDSGQSKGQSAVKSYGALLKKYEAKLPVTKKSALKAIGEVQQCKCLVYACLYPLHSSDFGKLTASIERLRLNDASVTASVLSSEALGAGFRCGFLGVLHMEVFQQRLEEDSGIEVILAAPSITYKAIAKVGGETLWIRNADEFPSNPGLFECFLQPTVRATLMCPREFFGAIQRLCLSHDGVESDVKFVGRSAERVVVTYVFPLARVVADFYTKVKAETRGLGSFDYEDCGWQRVELTCVRILINGKSVGPLSVLCEKQRAPSVGRTLCKKLAENIGRQLYEVNIQATIGGKVLAKQRLQAYRKNVLLKAGKVVGGGDPTRKKKLLEAQREGKKRMKQIGTVHVPQSAFLQVLKT